MRSLQAIKRLLERGQAGRRQQPHHIAFVVSAPRSGSTWLKRSLNGHPDVFCTENRLFGRFWEVWPNKDDTETPRITFDRYAEILAGHFDFQALGVSRDAFLHQIVSAYTSFLFDFARSLSGKRMVVDKITPYLGTAERVLESIRQFAPQARVLQLVRDGRDVATSGVFDWLLMNAHGKERYRFFVDREPGLQLRRFFDDEALEEWCDYWKQPIEAMRSVLPEAPLFRYEEMKAEPHATLGRILQCLGCPLDHDGIGQCVANASFSVMSGGRASGEPDFRKKTRKGIVGDWKNYFTRQDGELFHQRVGDLLMHLGYECDPVWYRQLPETLALTPAQDP